MPLKSGKKAISSNISELHKGNTYKNTKAKFGEDKANKQSIAIALNKASTECMEAIAKLSKKDPILCEALYGAYNTIFEMDATPPQPVGNVNASATPVANPNDPAVQQASRSLNDAQRAKIAAETLELQKSQDLQKAQQNAKPVQQSVQQPSQPISNPSQNL